MYLLYHYSYSQHARRVVSLLEEAGLDFELRDVDMGNGEYLSEEYSKINPNQQIPTLIDGKIKMHESNAILRYLCFKHNLKNWYPDNLECRAAIEQWLDWNQCRLSPSVVNIVVNKIFMGENGDLELIKQGEENIPKLFKILNDGLKDNNFLAGNEPTIADLSVASNIFQLGLASLAPSEPKIQEWYQRMNKIKGFQKSLPQN